MRSRTYAFMPWITATTATRNPTDTMIPSSVKNDRSLWLHAVWRAWRIASERGMAGENLTGRGTREEGRGARVLTRPPVLVPPPLHLYRPASPRFKLAALLPGPEPET